VVFTSGQSFIGNTGVRVLVNPVQTAVMSSIAAHARTTITDDGATPSPTHVIVIRRLLSVDIGPNPLTTDLVGATCAIPHRMVIPVQVFPPCLGTFLGLPF